MKTMVQSFLVEEVKELIYEQDKIDEWKEKCESLGLEGQLMLTEGSKNPIPFENMNEVYRRVFSTLCPAKEDYKKYRKTAIPLEALSLIALASQEKYFEKIEIWYDDKTPDPLAVGYIKKDTYSYDYFLIARWGDVLRPFEELKKKAIEVYINSSRISLKKKVVEAQSKLDQLEENAHAYFDVQAESYDVIGF